MATWTPITDIGWTGKIITTTMWNANFGANGNMQYIKETYERYYQASIGNLPVPNNTVSTLASYTIPAGWGNGLYFIMLNVETLAPSDTPIGGRRQVSVDRNSTTIAANNFVSEATASGIKPTYNIALYRRLSAGDLIEYRFYQLGASSTTFVLRASIQKVGV